ncbi:ATP synthase protein I [Rhodobium orientis]|uniref:ATP synthase protein I n=1 Tax=Rhodobium orientis TaxID=34017 RepID=A0A327JMZ2_9HYPH|nr:AtpZ/AtpI family protein [Rhodobium orientis]MBB4305642.1 ATP synthase protein I [Rhodobium orientis]MBK5949156.1 hypothetical protein [Rhodobium orientis]RAI24788.1 hypothetical protein CH339_21105 [Rhodobium orientis]
MSEDRPSPENDGKTPAPGSEAGLSERLDRLGRALNDRRRDEPPTGPADRNKGAQGYAQAFRLSTEFIAGILVGAALGWAGDQVLGTSPWGLIVFLLLGFAAGIFNVLRAAGLMAEPGTKKDDGTRGNDRPEGGSK